jgi:hypothetical protein
VGGGGRQSRRFSLSSGRETSTDTRITAKRPTLQAPTSVLASRSSFSALADRTHGPETRRCGEMSARRGRASFFAPHVAALDLYTCLLPFRRVFVQSGCPRSAGCGTVTASPGCGPGYDCIESPRGLHEGETLGPSTRGTRTRHADRGGGRRSRTAQAAPVAVQPSGQRAAHGRPHAQTAQRAHTAVVRWCRFGEAWGGCALRSRGEGGVRGKIYYCAVRQ